MARRSFRSVFRDPGPRRLVDAIEVERSRLGARETSDRPVPNWQRAAVAHLTDAERAVRAGDVGRGWTLVHLVHRLQVNGYTMAELVTEAMYVQQELSSGKFSPWRRQAIASQLALVTAAGPTTEGSPPGTPGAPLADPQQPTIDTRRTALIEALKTRDECYAGDYYDLTLVRRYQAILLVIALAILIGALAGSVFTNPRFDEGVAERWTAVGAALSGALGGITSALQRTTRRYTERIPQKIGSLVSSLSRPVIGAIAGVSVFLAVRAGLTQPSEQQVAYLLLVSFGAGFAERLVVRDPREESAARATGSTDAPTVPIDSSLAYAKIDDGAASEPPVPTNPGTTG